MSLSLRRRAISPSLPVEHTVALSARHTARSVRPTEPDLLPTSPQPGQSADQRLAGTSWWDRQKGLAELERYANSRGSQT